MRKNIITLLAVLACFGAFGAQQAFAYGEVKWATHVRVGGGENYFFGSSIVLYASAGEPYGQGLPCGGIRGYGLGCATKVGEDGYYILSHDVTAEPYLHDHSTFESYFNGWWFYE